jgi:hypothetical protein
MPVMAGLDPAIHIFTEPAHSGVLVFPALTKPDDDRDQTRRTVPRKKRGRERRLQREEKGRREIS